MEMDDYVGGQPGPAWASHASHLILTDCEHGYWSSIIRILSPLSISVSGMGAMSHVNEANA